MLHTAKQFLTAIKVIGYIVDDCGDDTHEVMKVIEAMKGVCASVLDDTRDREAIREEEDSEDDNKAFQGQAAEAMSHAPNWKAVICYIFYASHLQPQAHRVSYHFHGCAAPNVVSLTILSVYDDKFTCMEGGARRTLLYDRVDDLAIMPPGNSAKENDIYNEEEEDSEQEFYGALLRAEIEECLNINRNFQPEERIRMIMKSPVLSQKLHAIEYKSKGDSDYSWRDVIFDDIDDDMFYAVHDGVTKTYLFERLRGVYAQSDAHFGN